MKPGRGSDDAECKSRYACNRRSGKSTGCKEKQIEDRKIGHSTNPILLATIGSGDDRATLGRQVAGGWLPMTWAYYPRAQREVNRRLAEQPRR